MKILVYKPFSEEKRDKMKPKHFSILSLLSDSFNTVLRRSLICINQSTMKSFSFLIFFFSVFTYAQTLDSIQQLDEIVVSGTKYPIARKNSGKIVVKINSSDIKLNPGKNVAQLLDELAGVEINGSNAVTGKNQGVYIEGGKAGQVLLIVDGIPVTDPSGIDMSYDLNMLSTSQIESIEVMRGAAGTLYGSGAATAVIQIKTLHASKKSFDLDLGSSISTQRSQNDAFFNGKVWQQFINVSGTSQPLTYHVSVANISSGGISEAFSPESEFKENPYDKQNVLAKLGYQIKPDLQILLSGSYTKQYHLFDADAYTDSEVNTNTNEEWKIGLQSFWKYDTGKLNWMSEFKNFDRNYEQWNTWVNALEVYQYHTQSVQSDLFNQWSVNQKLDILSGMNFQFHQTDNTTPYGNIDAKTGQFYSLDPYLTLNVKDVKGFNMSLGSRLNMHNLYGSYLTFSFNPSYVYDISDNRYVKLMSSWSSAYIVPSIYQLHSVYGNVDLKPEITETLEFGTEISWSQKLNFSALYFERAENNSIIFYANPDTWESQYINDEVSSLCVTGFETALQWKPNQKLDLKTNYTYTHASKERPYSIPKNKWNARLRYQVLKGSQLQVQYQYASDRTQMDFSSYPYETQKLKNFHLFGIGWHQAMMQDKIDLHVGVDNIFNVNYVETIGYTSMGRNYALSMRYKL